MSNAATGTVTQQNAQDNSWASSSLGNYNTDIGNYNSNVNSLLAAGNPYQSKQYLTNQNIETSGAMNAANTTANQQARDTALRTGSNTAAVAADKSANTLASQRQLTDYNATRDTQNQDKWLQEQQGLLGDQLSGANSQAGVYSTQMGGENASLGDLTSIQNSQDQMWAQLGSSAMQGAGAGLTAAFA